MKLRLLSYLASILILLGCTEQLPEDINESFEIKEGETISFEGHDLEIEFLGAGTAHAINDDVIDDAKFMVTLDGKEENIYLESINGQPDSIVIGDYKIVLEFAYAYSQTCEIRVVSN